MTVDGQGAELIGKIKDTMARLDQLWDKVSLEQPARELRVQAAYTHFQVLIDDIVSA